MNIPKIDKAQLAKAIKSFFTKNMALKVIAFVFAMLLWGYVLTDQKPMREKEVPNVATSFDGEAELIAQGYCVRGDRSEILQDVSVKVRTQITNYAYVTPSSIVASISLRNISEGAGLQSAHPGGCHLFTGRGAVDHTRDGCSGD